MLGARVVTMQCHATLCPPRHGGAEIRTAVEKSPPHARGVSREHRPRRPSAGGSMNGGHPVPQWRCANGLHVRPTCTSVPKGSSTGRRCRRRGDVPLATLRPLPPLPPPRRSQAVPQHLSPSTRSLPSRIVPTLCLVCPSCIDRRFRSCGKLLGHCPTRLDGGGRRAVGGAQRCP